MTSKNQKGKRAIPKLKNNKDARRLEKIKLPRKRKPILLKNNLFKKKLLKKKFFLKILELKVNVSIP